LEIDHSGIGLSTIFKVTIIILFEIDDGQWNAIRPPQPYDLKRAQVAWEEIKRPENQQVSSTKGSKNNSGKEGVKDMLMRDGMGKKEGTGVSDDGLRVVEVWGPSIGLERRNGREKLRFSEMQIELDGNLRSVEEGFFRFL
jgi:hypothetical protein